jgi:dTDP-4-amino-4,6-dideoxygalactose transaminase
MMNEKIPCLDLSRQHNLLKKEIFNAFEMVYDKTAFSGGEFVEKFEINFANYIGANFAVAVSNGTAALHLAMLALEIGVDDEVILPANTFIATAWGVTYCGATPIFVDCDDSWNISIKKIESLITPKTKAIIGVHLYGQPFDIDGLNRLCKKHGLFMVEDAAQAQGAKYKNTNVGSFGDISCFSFYPGKNLGACGEGGAVITNNEVLAQKIRALRNHGSSIRYQHDVIGYNYRMGGLEAASLSVKLKYLNEFNDKRRTINTRYRTEINNELVTFQGEREWSYGVSHLFVVTVKNRAGFIDHLERNNIAPAFHYPIPCHLQGAYSGLGYKKGSFPESEYLAEHCVSLPMFPEMTPQEINHVISVVNSYRG